MFAGDIPNALPPPTTCNCCGSNVVEFVTNAAVYGIPFGKWPYCYMCRQCGAMVGCHPNTEIPMGRLADGETRQMRMKAHDAFDPIWRTGIMTRRAAYAWLSKELNIEDCHISSLSIEQLESVIEKSKACFEERKNTGERRTEKREETRDKRKAKVKKHISRRKDR